MRCAVVVDGLAARRRRRRAPCGWRPSGGGAGARAAGPRCPSRTSSAIFSASSRSARASLAQPSTRRDPRLDVDGLEQLDLALDGQLGPPADEVGQRARVVAGDGAEDPADLPAAEVLEQRPQRGPQLDAEAPGLVGDRRSSSTGSAVDPQPGAGADHAGAHLGPADGPDDQGLRAAGQLPGRLDLADHADLGVAARRSGGRAAASRRWPRRPRRRPSPRRTRARWSRPSPAAARRREGAGPAGCCAQWSSPRGASRGAGSVTC